MQISLKALALAIALLWGGCLLVVGLINIAAPPYGAEFLKVMSSVYPGFHASRTIADVLIGTVDGFIDGAIGGLLLGWLFNIFARRVTVGL